MVEEKIIDKFKIILDKIEKKRGSTILFGLFKMDEITDKWTIIVSATWVNSNNFKDIYFDLRDISSKVLNEREMLEVGRVGIFMVDNHLVEEILEKHDGYGHEIKNEKINGNYIHEGYLLKVSKLLAENDRSDKA